MNDGKHPTVRRHRSRSPANPWQVADRCEKLKSVVALAAVAIVLAVGVWLIVAGLSR